MNKWQLFREYWDDFVCEVRIKIFHPMYYPILNFFFPHNRLRIRNTPRSWNDRSERIIHAVFSMLCDYIEREEGGIAAFSEKVQEGLSRKGTDDYWPGTDRRLLMLELYNWYNAIDWKNPVPCKDGDYVRQLREEDLFWATAVEKAKQALDTSPGWWN